MNAPPRNRGYNPHQLLSELFRFQREWWFSRSWHDFWVGLPSLLGALLLAAVLGAAMSQSSVTLAAKYLVAANASLRDDDLERADLLFRQAIVLDETKPNAAFGRALVAEELGDAEGAVRMMTNLTTNASYTPAHIWMGERLMAAPGPMTPARLGATLHHLEQAVKWDPKNTRVHLLLGQLYTQSSQWDSAVEHLQAAAADAPELWLDIARIRKRNGEDEAARIAADAAVRVLREQSQNSTMDVAGYVRLAGALVLAEDFSQAVQTLENGLSVTKAPELATELATVYALWADFEAPQYAPVSGRQMELLKQAVDLAPNNPIVLQRLSAIAFGPNAAGLSNDAREVLEASLADGTAPALVHLILGTSAATGGDMEAARQHLELGYLQDEKSVAVLNNLAWLLSHQPEPDLERALKLVNEAVALAPDSRQVRETRGQVHTRLQHWKDAITDLEFALPAYKASVEIHESLALAYENIGNDGMAQRHRALAAELKAKQNPQIRAPRSSKNKTD